MKAVILAGGLGSRLSEETALKPKPMVEIGGKPLLWHIMMIYSRHGINDFVICLGYKGYMIKEYFANYYLHSSDITFDLSNNTRRIHQATAEPWKVTLVDTGQTTMTGGRLRQVLPHVGEEDFCFTYGDGVADVDVTSLIAFHRDQGRLATLTAVQPPGRFGALTLKNGQVTTFSEKPPGDGGWINGGFFVLSPGVRDFIDNDDTPWEKAPLERLAAAGRLTAFRHRGFWQAVDTPRDLQHLQDLWDVGKRPWLGHADNGPERR